MCNDIEKQRIYSDYKLQRLLRYFIYRPNLGCVEGEG